MNNIDKMHRQCFSKRKFLNEKAARKGIKQMLEKHGKKGRYYTCTICGWLHITTKGVE